MGAPTHLIVGLGNPGADYRATRHNVGFLVVEELLERHALEPERVLVVLDEVALPLGKLRLRPAGSPGGHRGLESILESVQTDRLPRLRLGVRAGEAPPAGEELVDFVLAPFAAGERAAVEEMVARAADAAEHWLREGPESAMSRYNG
jgi:peptidyl-tRNA hydrolase, PTH1 family